MFDGSPNWNTFDSPLCVWTYALALVGLEAVHIVGASDAPGAQELEQIDFDRRLHEDEVVFRHAEAVNVGGLEPLGAGELHHHLGLLNGVRFVWGVTCQVEIKGYK